MLQQSQIWGVNCIQSHHTTKIKTIYSMVTMVTTKLSLCTPWGHTALPTLNLSSERGQPHILAALSMGKVSLLPSKHEAGWKWVPVWTFWGREKCLAPSLNQTTILKVSSPKHTDTNNTTPADAWLSFCDFIILQIRQWNVSSKDSLFWCCLFYTKRDTNLVVTIKHEFFHLLGCYAA